jgi:hypothetical protein
MYPLLLKKQKGEKMAQKIKLILGFGLVLTLLSSCGLTPQVRPIEITTAPAEKPVLTLPTVDQLNLRPVDWKIITRENYEQAFAEIESSGRPVAMFSLSDEGYANLGLNFSDIRAMVQQQQAIIVAYENYYKSNNATVTP